MESIRPVDMTQPPPSAQAGQPAKGQGVDFQKVLEQVATKGTSGGGRKPNPMGGVWSLLDDIDGTLAELNPTPREEEEMGLALSGEETSRRTMLWLSRRGR